MEERFRGRILWITLAVLAVLGLCALLFFGAVFLMAPRPVVLYPGVPQVAPAPGQEGGVVPPYYGPGWGWGMHRGFGPLGLLLAPFRCLLPLLFFGLIFFLIFRGLRRHCWRHWAAGPWGPPAQPGHEGGNRPEGGPWGWHGHGGPWGPPPGRRPPVEPGEADQPPSSSE